MYLAVPTLALLLALGAFGGGAVAAVLAFFAWRRRRRAGATAFAVVLATVTLWVLLYGLAILSTDPGRVRLYFIAIQVLQVGLPVGWLVFAYEYAGRGDELTTRRRALLAAPLAVAGVVVALDLPFVAHSRIEVVAAGGLWLPRQELTAFGTAVVVYAYALIVASFVVLIRLLLNSADYHRRQIGIVIFATLLPTVASAVFISGVGPFPQLDLTPYAVAVECILVFYALFGVRLFDVTPVARAAVLDTLDAAVVVVDEDGRVVDSNAAARAFGAVDAPEGHPFGAAFPAVATAYDAGHATVTVEVDGTSRTFAVSESALTGRRGQRARVLVLSDITERLRRERALEALSIAASDLMEADDRVAVCERAVTASVDVLELPLCMVHLRDGDTLEPVAATTATEERYDSLPSYAVGEGVVGTAFAREAPVGFERVERAPMLVDGDTPFRSVMVFPLDSHGTLTVGAPDRTSFSEEVTYFARILAGNVTYALDRATREAELQTQNERLDEFASVVSHDLRNPLAVAQGHLDLLRETHEDEHVDAIGTALDRMEDLVADVLTLARQGQAVGATEPLLLHGVVEDAWGTVDGDGTLVADLGDARVVADRSRLRQLFENLFRNCVEHAGPAVTVEVGTLPDGFFVADDGPGIPADQRERVLEPGYTSTGTGTGLGLAIVADIAAAHGWSVEVAGSASGGVRFEFTGVGTPD